MRAAPNEVQDGINVFVWRVFRDSQRIHEVKGTTQIVSLLIESKIKSNWGVKQYPCGFDVVLQGAWTIDNG